MQKLISVIVCTYNQENTIGRTLDSILHQQCHVPFEIIIGEDHSTDGTLDVCLRYAERYPDIVRVIANNPNKGLVDNYYDCILAAKGQYIADCAGDDFWCDDKKLEKEVTILEQNPDVGIVHTEWQYYNEDTGETIIPVEALHKEAFIDGKLLLEDILTQTQRPVIHLCTSLYRAKWFVKAHQEYNEFFRNKTYNMEDVQVCFFLARMGQVAYLPDITLSYSRGGETISFSTDEVKQARFIESATKLTYDLASRFDLMTPRIKKYLQQKQFGIIMHAFRSHNKELRDHAISLSERWHITSNAQTRVVRFCTSQPFLWQMVLILRQAFVEIKKYYIRLCQ